MVALADWCITPTILQLEKLSSVLRWILESLLMIRYAWIGNLDDDNAASKRDQQKISEKKKKRPQPFKFTRMLLCPCFVVYRSLQKVFFFSLESPPS